MNEKFKFKTQIRVKTFDLDSYGIVHNSVYFKYFEIARVEYIRKMLGIDPVKFLKTYYFVIARNECNYITPAELDDILDIYARVSYIGRTSFEMEYLIVRNGTEIADGKSVAVLLDKKTLQPIELPENFKQKIIEIEGKNLTVKKNSEFA